MTPIEKELLVAVAKEPLTPVRAGQLALLARVWEADGLAEQIRRRDTPQHDRIAAGLEIRAAELRKLLDRWPETVREYEAKRAASEAPPQ